MRPPISVAEAVRAAVALEPADGEARDAMLGMLGVGEAREVSAAPVTLGVWKPSSTEAVGQTPRPPAIPIAAPEGVRLHPPSSGTAPGARTRATLAEKAGPPPAPAWLLAPGPTVAAVPVQSRTAPPDPLFSARTGRAILTAALSTFAAEGDVDIPRVLEQLASRRPLTSLPRVRTPTLRQGAQVLVDFGAGMDPYRQDAERLVAQLDHILADDRFIVAGFTGTPLRGIAPMAETDHERVAWTPPPPGTPVVVVTDLGIGGPLVSDDRAHAGEWLLFARAVRSAGHALIAFVPYEARRWPPRLGRALTILHWSERTTVGAVRRAIREASGGRR